MKIEQPRFEILGNLSEWKILKKLERCARVCYKSEGKIKEGSVESAEKLVRALIKSGHHSVLEHVSITVLFVSDRAIINELERHRHGSYSQESTRFVDYAKDASEDGGGEITVIKPSGIEEDTPQYANWYKSCSFAEQQYLRLRKDRCRPEEARSVLPLCTKSEVAVTMNLRSWRDLFDKRVVGTTGKPHPDMIKLLKPLLIEFKRILPVIFEDIPVE